MKQANEQPQQKKSNLEIETSTLKEELKDGDFHMDQLKALERALNLLVNKAGTLEIKNSADGIKSAIVYEKLNHKPILMTDVEWEVDRLLDPESGLAKVEAIFEEFHYLNKALGETTEKKGE